MIAPVVHVARLLIPPPASSFHATPVRAGGASGAKRICAFAGCVRCDANPQHRDAQVVPVAGGKNRVGFLTDRKTWLILGSGLNV